MKKCSISIARQFGSLGRPIAKELSQLLGIEYYDRDIIEKVAKETGKSIKTISDMEETANYFYMKFPLGNATTEEQDNIFSIESRIIVDLVEKNNCIIVGRCSDYILKDNPAVIKIFVYASLEDRLKNCVDVLKMNEKTALKTIKEVDKARNAYHKHYTGKKQDNFENYDVLINSSLLGIKGTAELIKEIYYKNI